MRGLAILICGLLAIISCAAAEPRLHELMTDEERAQVFQAADGNVEDYEIVPIHWPKVQKRSSSTGTGIYLTAFGENIKLWLKPIEGILAGYDTPVYTLKSGTSGPQFVKHPDVMKKLKSYEDLGNTAALVVQERGNDKVIMGTIESKKLIITPIPERLVKDIKRQRRDVDKISGNDHHYHVIYKMPMLSNAIYDRSLVEAQKVIRSSITKVPEIIYPELLVVVANDLYKKMGGKVLDATAYLVAFWNGVDLKYRNFERPKFRLNIAGIVLTEDELALNYIPEYKYDGHTLIVEDALKEKTKWWYSRKSDIPLDTYDAVITMTTYDLCAFDKGIDCIPGILGLAVVGGTCHVSDYFKLIHRVAIIQDKAGFDGIHTAAHELGHLLGAMHDGVDHTSCPFSDGYIMAGSPVLSKKSSDWSDCSLKDIQYYLEGNSSCLFNKPSQKNPLPRYLPGKFFDATEQCKILEGTEPCVIDETICQRLKCVFAKDNNYCKEMNNAAAEGTNCGPGKLCLHGQCIDESDI